MEKIIQDRKIIFVDQIKMRQMIEIEKVKNKADTGSELELVSDMLCILIVSIDEVADKVKIKDILLDELDPTGLGECAGILKELMSDFEKKSLTLSTSMKSSSWTESENSHQNG